MTHWTHKISAVTLPILLTGTSVFAGGEKDPPVVDPAIPIIKRIEQPVEPVVPAIAPEVQPQIVAGDKLDKVAAEGEPTLEDLQIKLNQLKLENDRKEKERQKELEQKQQRDEILRQLSLEEKRQKELENPIQAAPQPEFVPQRVVPQVKPETNSEKDLADNLGDLFTNGIKSLTGNGNGSHVNNEGNYVPSDFVKSREAFKKSFRDLFS